MQGLASIEDVETFMLKHGENIVDTLGGEVDRIEKILKVRIPLGLNHKLAHHWLEIYLKVRIRSVVLIINSLIIGEKYTWLSMTRIIYIHLLAINVLLWYTIDPYDLDITEATSGSTTCRPGAVITLVQSPWLLCHQIPVTMVTVSSNRCLLTSKSWPNTRCYNHDN